MTCFWTDLKGVSEDCSSGGGGEVVTLGCYMDNSMGTTEAPWSVASGVYACIAMPNYGSGSGDGSYMSRRFSLTEAQFNAISCGIDVDLSAFEYQEGQTNVYSADNNTYAEGFLEMEWESISIYWLVEITAVDTTKYYSAFIIGS